MPHRSLLLLVLPLVLAACQPAAEAPPAVATVDGKKFTLTDLPGSTIQRAERRTPTGILVEAGFVKDGLRHGTWTTYEGDRKTPTKIMSYVDGALNGPYLEFDQSGRPELVTNYRANELHGHYGKYRLGRPELETNYVRGQIDGVLAEYDYRTNKLKRQVGYKAGVLDGETLYFDGEGQVVHRTLYRAGEKIEGQ